MNTNHYYEKDWNPPSYTPPPIPQVENLDFTFVSTKNNEKDTFLNSDQTFKLVIYYDPENDKNYNKIISISFEKVNKTGGIVIDFINFANNNYPIIIPYETDKINVKNL